MATEQWFDGAVHYPEDIPQAQQRVVGFKFSSGYSEDLVGPWETPDLVALVEDVPKKVWEHADWQGQERCWSSFILALKEIARQLGGDMKGYQKNEIDPKTHKTLSISFELWYEGEPMPRL